MTAFATLADYEVRCGAVSEEDVAKVEALLEDASAFMLGQYRRCTGRDYEACVNVVFDANAKAVCVAMVSRAVSASGALTGVTQQSQTAGSYSQSYTYANPTGDLYLGRSDLKRLGLAGARVGSIDAMTYKDRGACDV